MPLQFSATSGWCCPNCGVWVQSGDSHYCTRTIPYLTVNYPVDSQARDLWRIAQALEEIAKAMQDIASRG